MSTRSKYLARVLLTRTQALARVLREDAPVAARHSSRSTGRLHVEMRDLVAKVLVVEEGITDESKVRLVLDALPSVEAKSAYSERELQELAATLEARLWK